MIKKYTFKGNTLRLILVNGDFWVVAKDLARCLNYASTDNLRSILNSQGRKIINPYKSKDPKIQKTFRTPSLAVLNFDCVQQVLSKSKQFNVKFLKDFIDQNQIFSANN